MSDGVNSSERYLTKLGRRTFLSLWSHSNLFRSQAKELADLVVVCHNIVIIFSDKNIRFNQNIDTSIAWIRWYNKAVLESVKQLRRAEGWIRNHRNRIYRDPKCQDQIDLFWGVDEPVEVHLVAVANGAAAACLRFFGSGSGALVAMPSSDPRYPPPFCVGNPAGDQSFVHVFDESNLNVILQELDTIQDFVDYLSERRRVFESKSLMMSSGEEDLLAVYLRNVDKSGKHAFVDPNGELICKGKLFAVQEGMYDSYCKRAEYKRKKKADKISYFWDHLIESFSHNFRNGTLEPVPEPFSAFDGRHMGAEIGLRYMALEPRIIRRANAEAILGAFDSLEKSGGDRFFRSMLPPGDDERQTAFFVLLLNRESNLAELGYLEYRTIRAAIAHAYSQNLLLKYPRLQRAVGIATEGEMRGGRSEDLIYQERPEWNDKLIAETRELAERFDIFLSVNERQHSAKEYPETELGLRGTYRPVPYQFFPEPDEPSAKHLGNRAQRRKQAARSRRAKRRG